MKQKAQRFTGLISSINDLNYRDISMIIDQFNSSIRAYKRFEDFMAGGDETAAKKKLNQAGTDLYKSCEWSMKNYLYKVYKAEEGIPEWRRNQLCANLSTRDATLVYLVREMKNHAIPSCRELEINMDLILEKSTTVNNAAKHDAHIPDPNDYRLVVGEIRKIIQNYVDKTAVLDVISDAIYGEEKNWYELIDNTNNFSEDFSYILVTSRLEAYNARGLFSLKWDLVLDMDPSTDIDGLESVFESLNGSRAWIRMLDGNEARKPFTLSHLPYWIKANGNSDDPNSIEPLYKWNNRKGKFLNPLLERFHTIYVKPAKVFIYLDNEKNLERIIQEFNDSYDNNDEPDVDFYVLSAKQEYARIEEENFKVMTMSFDEFCDNLAIHFSGKNEIIEAGAKTIPASNGEEVVLDNDFFEELLDSFEVLYKKIAEDDEKDFMKTDEKIFYKGILDISWFGIRENFDVIRNEKDTIIKKIEEDIHDRGRVLKKVYYEPGIGGTTLMRRIAWEIRLKYPTLILKKTSDQILKNLQKLYDKTHSPFVIFVDNNDITIEEVQNMHIKLKPVGFAFVICYFERKLKSNPVEKGGYSVIPPLHGDEIPKMVERLNTFIDDSEVSARMIDFVSKSNEKNYSLGISPFILSMYAFNKEFRGIKPFIARFLNGMNDQAKQILFDVALADYGNTKFPCQFFDDYYNDENFDIFLLDKIPGINELVRVEKLNGIKYIRIRYHLFAEEILKQLSYGRDSEIISFTVLLDYIIQMINESRPNKYHINADNVQLLRTLFITRQADVDSEKPKFSPLIEKLREENSEGIVQGYDTSNDAITRIFNKLVETYPDEAHFTAHLARYYFYIDKNYEQGLYNINKAIELSGLSDNVNGMVDPILYHVKAMGYSSRITSVYIPQIQRNINNGHEDDNSIIVQNIESDASEAFKYFKMVRDSNIGLAGHVSEINLCISIARMARNMLSESGYFSAYVMADVGNWSMKYIDKASSLWDECQKLSMETNYEDLDGIGVKLRAITSDIEDEIQLWESYLQDATGQNAVFARRILARAYEKENREKLKGDNIQENLYKIIRLMEDNMIVDSNQPANIRIWFDAVMKLESDSPDAIVQDAMIKLNRWVSLTDAVEAHYYRFILKFMQAKDGSELAAEELPKLLSKLKNKSISLYNRTTIHHWLMKDGKGLLALKKNSKRLIQNQYHDSGADMADDMQIFIGRISEYKNDSHAYIKYKGINIYFNPSATNGEIDASKNNQRVKFGVGFSYDGPRAFNSSIKLMGIGEGRETNEEVSFGNYVNCEVINNIAYYVKVRLFADSAPASIHINELVEPFSADNRPRIGQILYARVLGQNFNNKTQEMTWQLTLKPEPEEEKEFNRSSMVNALEKLKNVQFE